MLCQLTHGSPWETSLAAHSRFTNTRSCEIKAKANVLANWQEAKDAAAAVEEDLKAHAAEEALAGAGDGYVLQLTVQTPPATCSSHTERRKAMFGQHIT